MNHILRLIKRTGILFMLSITTMYGTCLAQQKPNIIVFLVDDMGWMDTSVPFSGQIRELNERYHTPNMERLAKAGVVFTNAYATPVCTPSRVSLMTGVNAAHHKVTNWTSVLKDTPSDFDNEENPLKTPEWNLNGLSPVPGISGTFHANPLPLLLKDAGYYTIHVGKAHFAAAGTPGASPYNLGFLVNIAGNVAGAPRSYWGEENYGNIPEKTNYYAVQNMTEYYGTDTYLTEALTLEALKALEYPVKTRQPFFLYMAHYAVHLPLYEDKRFAAKYTQAGLNSGQVKYATMIEGMDKSLGDLMDFVEREGIANNTVVMFMSDNGGHSVSKAKGDAVHTNNFPLREGKGSVYEGGIREPMIVSWPGNAKPGLWVDEPVIIEDFFPSILEMAALENVAVVQEVDGKSFCGLLRGEAASGDERGLVWHYPHKWKAAKLTGIDYMSAVRQGDWKLVYNLEEGRLELYQLSNDLGEQHDVATKYPAKVKELAILLGDKLRGWQSAMPSYKADGRQVPWPDEVQ